MIKQLIRTLFLLLAFASIAKAQTNSENNDLNNTFKQVKWRSIGPFRGGRSNIAVGVSSNPMVYYMGTTGGGLWKTEDMGVSWNNISDGFFKTATVGGIAVAESDPNIVYVGMGEHAVRGVMTHHGDGMYKSTDAGKTWKKIGLDATHHIARVVVDPKNPNIVFVAAQGSLFSSSNDRGVYKSIDGGATWNKVLFVDEKTGCAELSMDMNNPTILYAAMWEHGRTPWKVTSGGPGSGLYKSTDGGATWNKMQNGLPKEMGKMAIAVSRANSDKVYALIESDFTKEAGGMYVSENAGKTWSHVTSDHRLIGRAWYYIEVFADPLIENTLYVMNAPALKSTDGGKIWENMSATHGDFHNLWISPNNSNNMIIANDGGAAITFNGGKTWSSEDVYATGQFYRINVDNEFPYNIYGGQQDNTSVKIASRSFHGGINTTNWSASAGGESAFLAFDPNNPRYVLGGSYQGTIEVFDSKSKASTNIMAAPIQYLGKDAKDNKYRFNWNAPIIWSKHEPNTFYHGGQLLLRTNDMGKTWSEASPDLTRNEKSKQGKPGGPFTNEAVGAENYGTLSYIIESPNEKGVIYTGSDDGYVYVTRDGCKTWTNITPAGLSECLINSIEVSPFDNATAYIATTRYKFDDHTPGLYKTTDYGKTWTKINTGIAPNAFTRVIREDTKVKDLLFAGTELGMYISQNGGKNWTPFQLNLPNTPITDLRIHQDNLIASTSGRAFWILDDLTLLRQYKKDTSTVKLYQPANAYLANGYSELNQNNEAFTGSATYEGVNPANGVVLYYQLPTLKENEEVTMEIKDAAGNTIRKFSSKDIADASAAGRRGTKDPKLSANKGLNRFVWDMRYPSIPNIPGVYIESSFKGHKAIPGNYTITVKAGDQTSSTTASILANPLYQMNENDYQEFDALMKKMEGELITMHTMINNLNESKNQLENVLKNLPADEKYSTVKNKGEEVVKLLKAWDEDMIQRKSTAYDDVENFPNKFTANYMFMVNQAESEIPRVNQPVLDLLKEYTPVWETLKARGMDLKNNILPALNKQLWEAGVGAVMIK